MGTSKGYFNISYSDAISCSSTHKSLMNAATISDDFVSRLPSIWSWILYCHVALVQSLGLVCWCLVPSL